MKNFWRNWWTKRNGTPPTETVLTLEPTERRTMAGWPCGEQIETPEDWDALIDPRAMVKLETWHKNSAGLELSGYALLAEPVKADPGEPYTFVIEDMLLGCAIQESTGGYTEMSPEIRVQLMMKARSMGYKPDQLAWWHKHPITNWSGIDVNALRQRVHETGLDRKEQLQTFAFVLTPSGIRARWDRSGPDQGDNAYVDRIPVQVMAPDLREVAEEAKTEVLELLKQRQDLDKFRADEDRCAEAVVETEGGASA